MKSFGITVAFILTAVSAGVGALPTDGEALARRDGNFFFPIWRPYTPPAKGPISASGANGGYNYGGNGANGGSIAINSRDEHIWPYPARAGSQNSVSGWNSGRNSGQIGTMRGGGFRNSVSGVNSGFNSGTVGAM